MGHAYYMRATDSIDLAKLRKKVGHTCIMPNEEQGDIVSDVYIVYLKDKTFQCKKIVTDANSDRSKGVIMESFTCHLI